MRQLGKITTSCLAAVVGCIAVASAALAGAAAPKPFEVGSTLEGRKVLPQRIAWFGRPSVRASLVAEVAFLIDGKVRWVERGAPYTYSDDGGYLVTSWLRPGWHRFAVRATLNDGRIATNSVTARVVAAPKPPAQLVGRWRRDVQGTPETLGGPPGLWTLVFERRWLQDRAPGKWNPDTQHGSVIDNYWVPGARTFEVAGSVTFRVLNDTDAEGGWWCEPGGPRAAYSWSVEGDTLTLAPRNGRDPCRERGAVYTGEWTRVR
jgi:hypothetical protein